MKAVLEIDGSYYLVTKAQAIAVMNALAGAPRLRRAWTSDTCIKIKPEEYDQHYRVTTSLAQPSMRVTDDRYLHVVEAPVDDPNIEQTKPITKPSRRSMPAPRQRLLLTGGGQ